MSSLRLRHTNGLYSLITTFLFIMVVLFVVLAMIYLSKKLTIIKADVNDNIQKYDNIRDVKNRLLSQECYGQTLSLEGPFPVNKTCTFPPGVIKGYKIRMEAWGNCSNETREWVHMFSDEMAEEQPYFVVFQDNESSNICPGVLTVLI